MLYSRWTGKSKPASDWIIGRTSSRHAQTAEEIETLLRHVAAVVNARQPA